MRNVSQRFDGAYSLVLLNALGDMLVARDPLGIKPLCYANEGTLFAAASESVALLNLGFRAGEHSSRSLPGHAITITDGEFEIEPFRRPAAPGPLLLRVDLLRQRRQHARRPQRLSLAHRARRRAGPAGMADGRVPLDDDTIVVPVPDTSKAAADAMAYQLGVPSREGLIRNRYAGRTFIEGGDSRVKKAETKYTPLREVLEGKRVLPGRGFDRPLDDDAGAAQSHSRRSAAPKEIHVRVACPPIVAPCFYGIDMSTVDELFAPKFLRGRALTDEVQAEMAAALGADSLRYLPVESIARAIDAEPTSSARPASPATIRRRTASSSTRSPSTTSAKPTATTAPTKCSTR